VPGMGPRRSRLVRGGGGRSRRKLVWATADGTIALAASPNSVNVDLTPNFRVAGASLLGVTIMRTRGSLTVDNTGRAVGNRVKWGFLVGRTTDLPGTIALANDDSLDWMLIQSQNPVSSGGAVGQERFEVDLRARRKMQELDQAYLLAASNTSGAAMSIRYYVRTLLALP